jgi:GT2 family glycosyltransferase
MPALSVVIPHRDDLAGLALCAEALRRQVGPAFEIVVADNGSACGMAAVAEAAPGCRVVHAPLPGAGPARNAGIAAARGEVIALLDSDCVPDPHWLAEGVAALARHDIVGGRVVTTAADPAAPTPVEAFEIVFNFDFRRYIERVGFTGTGNMFVPRAVFYTVGPFRTGVAEDMEWCFRARAAGFRIGYAERAMVTHPARRDWAALRRRWARLVAEHAALAREEPHGRLRWMAKALAMPLSVPPHAWRVLRDDRLPGWEARLGAVTVLARLRLWRMREMLRAV